MAKSMSKQKRTRLVRNLYLKMGIRISGYHFCIATIKIELFNKFIKNQAGSLSKISDAEFLSRIRCMNLQIAMMFKNYYCSPSHPFFKNASYLASKNTGVTNEN